MTAPGNNAITMILALAIVISSSYAAGRIHQWYKYGAQRDELYRQGYDKATHSMYAMISANEPPPADHGRTRRSIRLSESQRSVARLRESSTGIQYDSQTAYAQPR